jgi:alcohol dehydrogenase class IV
MGEDDILTSLDTFLDLVGLDRHLERLGLQKKDLRQLSEFAMKDACTATNPKTPQLEDIVAIYEQTL